MDPVCVFSDSDTMAGEIARCFEKQTRQAANNQQVFSVVLSGGGTAPVLYKKLAEPEWRNRICWESVHIFFADERCVPPDHEESNYRIICESFVNHVSIPKTNIHRIRGEDNPQKESLRYAKEIQKHLALRNKNGVFFDWVLLGVGVDGHTASLFPGQKTINSKELCEAAQHPETGQSRITMTPVALNQSARITYHCIGKEKSGIISTLASEPSAKNKYPALQIQGEWFLDLGASAKFDFS